MRYCFCQLSFCSVNAFSPLRASEKRKSVYGAKTLFAKAKTRLPSKNVAHKGVYEGKCGTENRKRLYRSKTSLAKSKTLLSGEIVAQKIRNRDYRAKPSHEKSKTRLPIENVSTERIPPNTPEKTWLARFNQTKMWLTKVKTCLSRENVPRKGGNAFYREKTKQAKAKKSLPRENAFTERQRVPRAKTSLAKAKSL